MNDAKCDSRGRLWAGSTAIDFTPGEGALHVLEPDWSTRVVLEGLTLPNGLDWSPDGSTFYLIDSVPAQVWAFDFDQVTASLANRRRLYQFAAGIDIPDGMCTDTAGRLWIAMWGGARVVCLSPAGRLVCVVHLPVTQPSSCAFVGARLDRLAVTSAREGLSVPSTALDGSVLIVDGLPAVGRPSNRFYGL